MNASRIPWLVTVGICAIAALLLASRATRAIRITVGAVGLAAAVNLT